MRKLILACFSLTVLFSCSLSAQTRLYLPSSGAAAVSPTFSAGWDDTGGADHLALATASGGATAQVQLTSTDTVTTTDADQLWRQYVSPPLNGAQSISGTVKGQVKVKESSNAQNARAQLVIYVVSNDGSTVRGILLDFDTSALSSEFSTSNINKKFPLAAISPATLSSVSASDCDRLVIEYGARDHSTGVGATVSATFGDDSATDLAENETSSATSDPWIEFSGTISFRAEGACGGGGGRTRRVLIN